MKKLKRLAAVLLVLTLSLSLAAPVFASNYERSENGYHKMVYLDTPNTAYYSSYTTSGMPQAAYVGTNFTNDQSSLVAFTVRCKSGTTTWQGAYNTLPGWSAPSSYIEISGYTTNRGLSNTVYQIIMDHINGPLDFARGMVKRPSAKAVLTEQSVWREVTIEESAFAKYN